MADDIKFKRGDKADRPALDLAEPGFNQDSEEFFIGKGTGDSADDIRFTPDAAVVDYTLYVAGSGYGGNSAANGRTGRELASGTITNTWTSSDQFEDSNASFTSALVGMTIYNVTTGKWAYIYNFISSTVLEISEDITAGGDWNVGDSYVIASAFDNVPDALNAIRTPYLSNVTVRISDGTFSDDITLVGIVAGADKALTLQGEETGSATTYISGSVDNQGNVAVNDIEFNGSVEVSSLATWTNVVFNGNIDLKFGASVTWTNCTIKANCYIRNGASATADNVDTSGGRVFVYGGSSSHWTNGSTITVANDPQGITSVNSTVNIGYKMYVATAALGGDDSVADGLTITSGSATGTSASKLIDSGASFDSSVLDKPVYNSTDGTWAKVTAVDSSTQLSLSADIMASGEAYVIANAFSTVQGAVDAVPGTFNCNTDIRVSDGTFAEDVTVQGKTPSGNYTLDIIFAVNVVESGTVDAASGRYISVSGSPWTTDQHKGRLFVLTSGGGELAFDFVNYASKNNWITSNYTGQLNFSGVFTTNPSNGDTFDICTLATNLQSLSIVNGQKAVRTKFMKINGGGYDLQHLNFSDGLHDATEFSGGSVPDIANGSSAYFFLPYAHDIDGAFRVRIESMGDSFGAWIEKGTGSSGAGISVATQTHFNFRQGCLVDGFATGVLASVIASIQFLNNGNSDIKNCTTGLKAISNSFARYISYITFTSCTTDYDPVGASDASYIA